MHSASSGTVKTTQSGQSDSTVSSRNPGQRRTGGRRRSVKQSSQGPGVGSTQAVGRDADLVADVHRAGVEVELERVGDAGQPADEPRVPADVRRHRLVGVDLEPAGQGIRRQGEALDGTTGERPVGAELGLDRRLVDHPPGSIQDGPVDRVRRHRPWQLDRPTLERERRVPDPPGIRGHRERTPGDRPVALGLEQLPTIDDERGDPAPDREIDRQRDTGGRKVEGGGRRSPDRPASRPSSCRRPRRPPACQRRPLGDELVDRRGRPEDLLVDPDDDPADRLSDRLPFLLRGHVPQSSGGWYLGRGSIRAVEGMWACRRTSS